MEKTSITRKDLATVYQTLSMAMDHAIVYNLPTERIERVRMQILDLMEKV